MKYLLVSLVILSSILYPQQLPKSAPGQAIVIFNQTAYSQIRNELLQESLQTSNSDANQLFSTLQVTKVQNILKKDSFDQVEEETGLNRSFVIYFPANTDAEIDEAVNELKKSYLIEDAFPNALGYELADPNDLYYNQTSQYNLYKIKMSQAWDLQKGSSTIRTAILDWGFQPTHQELDDKIYLQKDYTDLNLSNYSGWSFPNEDVVGVDDDATGMIEHGTDVAQVAAAETNNGYGIAGVGWNTPLVLVRCGFQGINPLGGTIKSCETDDVINAVNWIRTSGNVKVINISFGWPGSPSPLLQSAINSCLNDGIVVVAAAGNNPGGSVYYPAAYPGVIAVSGTNQQDINDSWAQGPQVSVVAPANSIRTMTMNGGVKSSNGTSLAAPQVAGAVALLFSQKPDLTPELVKKVIEASAFKVAGMNGQNFHNYYGYGLLDVYEALRATNSIYTFTNKIMSNDYGSLVIDNDKNNHISAGTKVPFKYETNHNSRTNELPFLVNYSGTTQKFNRWYDDEDSDFNLQLSFTANSLTPPVKDANFNSTVPLNIRNNFLEAPSLDPTTDNIWLYDPWFFYKDVNNNWFQSSEFKQYSSPLNIFNNTTDSYGGVFLDQGYNPVTHTWTPPYYSVKAVSPQDVYLSQTGKTHKFYFRNWGGSGVSYKDANALETGVVFTSGTSSSAEANFKGTQLSNNQTAYSTNSQRKFVRTDDGYLHQVYESMGYVWYEVRNPSTQVWEIKNGGKPLGNGLGKNPSIDYKDEMVVIVWQENAGSAGSNIKLATFSSGTDLYNTKIFETTLATEYLSFDKNLEPVVIWSNNSYAFAAWHGWYDGDWGPTEGLVYKYFTLSSNYLNLYSAGYIVGTDANSCNPTVSIYKNPSPTLPPLFHFAWSQNQTSVYYCQLKPTLAYTLQQRVSAQDNSTYKNLSTYSGYTKNYMPTLAILQDDLARIAWIGERTESTSGDGLNKISVAPPTKRTVFRGINNDYNFWYFGSSVTSASVQSTGDNNYYIVWSGSGGTNMAASYTGFSLPLNPISSSGNQVHVASGSSTSTTYAMMFNNTSLPYNFAMSNSLASYYSPSKEKSGEFVFC